MSLLLALAASVNATASGQTVSYTYSLIDGSASSGGAIDATGNGTTLSFAYSVIDGAATSSSQATGTTLSYAYSIISGQGQSSSQATGVTLPYTYSLIAGAASGNLSATANGTTVTYTYGLIDGLATGSSPSTFIRGDDGGYASNTGAAKKAIYDRQLAEFKEEVQQAPKRKAKQQKIEALEEKLVLIEDTFRPIIPKFEFAAISDAITGLAASEIDYAAFQVAVLIHLENIEAEIAIQNRKRLHRNIALSMLVNA